jgi:hypothetical protein
VANKSEVLGLCSCGLSRGDFYRKDGGINRRRDGGMNRKGDGGMNRKRDGGMNRRRDGGMNRRRDGGMNRRRNGGMLRNIGDSGVASRGLGSIGVDTRPMKQSDNRGTGLVFVVSNPVNGTPKHMLLGSWLNYK